MRTLSADATVFDILAEPHRRRILDLLREQERPVSELVTHLSLAQPTVSKHLKLLRQCGLVNVRKDAQRRLYRLTPAPLIEIDTWLAPYRRLWSDRLAALERHLDAMPDPTTGTSSGRQILGNDR
jgi:DNA-binding transcriptional ArsR family regulator